MEKIWFVTGAGHGFGLALVKQLLKQGCRVAAVAENIQALRRSVQTPNANLLMLEVDLFDEDRISRAAYDAVEHFGRLDIVINADKEWLAGNIENLTDEHIRRNFEINVFSGLNLVRAVLPYLKEQRSGHIFNLSSPGRKNAAGLGIYRATELGMIAILESLAVELQPFGIDVSAISPGDELSDLTVRAITNNTSRQVGSTDSIIKQLQLCMHQCEGIAGGSVDLARYSSTEGSSRFFYSERG